MNTYSHNFTALYVRLSQEDALDGESSSIANQKRICQEGLFCESQYFLFREVLARSQSEKLSQKRRPYWRGFLTPRRAYSCRRQYPAGKAGGE